MCCSCGVVWDVEGGGGLPIRRHSYRGHRVELWRIFDGTSNDKNSSKPTRVNKVGCTWTLSGQKQVQFALDSNSSYLSALYWPNGRARGVRFDLILKCTWYLFLAPNGPGVPVFSRCPFLYASPQLDNGRWQQAEKVEVCLRGTRVTRNIFVAYACGRDDVRGSRSSYRADGGAVVLRLVLMSCSPGLPDHAPLASYRLDGSVKVVIHTVGWIIPQDS